ncbi:hypothetical protein [Streptomyces sp. Ru71]|uniref:hypothetical protein n=1 Tax=Streptomyces sp. Ru71 TaxID=2080746 RepID=UPI0021562EDB|nr:hypothetical protein [Streptomyces sp. Ru71]
MEFRFSIDENVPPPPSGYDLGHVDVTGNLGEATSRGGPTDQAMMIYLSLTLLLDGLRRFLFGRDRSYSSAAVVVLAVVQACGERMDRDHTRRRARGPVD